MSAGLTRLRQHRGAVGVALFGLVFLAWRATLGFDLRDGSYVVALGQRLARGEVPFVDELSPIIFGSVLLAPVIVLWEAIAGTDGVVLVARLAYVAMAAAVGWVSWRALAPFFGSTLSALAVLAGVLALPYNLQVLSYNTTPQLLLLLASAAGLAAVLGGSGRWGAVASTAAAVASVAHVGVLPGAMLLLLSILWARSRFGPTERATSARFVGCVLLPGFVVGCAFVAWIALVPGWEAVQVAVGVQADRPSGIALEAFYWHFLAGAKLLPVFAALVGLGFLSRGRLRALLLGLSALSLTGWAGAFGPPEIEPSEGRYAGAVALVIVVTFLVPLVIWAVRAGERAFLALTAVAVPSALVGAVMTSAMTMSGAAYGAYAVPMAGVMALVVLGVGQASTHSRPVSGWGLVPAVGLNAALAASLLAVVFNEGAFIHARHRVPDGPAAGLLVGEASMHNHRAVSGLVDACPEGSTTFLSLWVPGAYLWWGQEGGAAQYWLGPVEDDDGYRYMARSGAVFDCILGPLEPGSEGLPAGLQALLDEQYLLVHERELHGVVGSEMSTFGLWVRRDAA